MIRIISLVNMDQQYHIADASSEDVPILGLNRTSQFDSEGPIADAYLSE